MRVVKIGGAQLSDAAWLARFARLLGEAGGAGGLAISPLMKNPSGVSRSSATVVVHGGGHAITAAQNSVGIPVIRQDGIRTTTPELAAVVKDVLCGSVRALITGALEPFVKPVGIAGLDGYLQVRLVDPKQLGRVGEVTEVNTKGLRSLLARGFTPVLAPVCVDGDGEPVNVNADHVAASVARALGASELLFLSDVAGVMRNGQVVPSLHMDQLPALVSGGVVTEGMVEKLKAACLAAVPRVRIGSVDMLQSAQAGTTIESSNPVYVQ